ncbi:MAG: hypothetical protein ACI9FR_002348 [Cryomorphaceae bacterium]|jgi:uncharacterized protein YbjT (DUF2867 family)
MKQKAIVIGATGLVGAQVVEQLSTTEGVSEIVTITRRPVEHSSAKVVNHVVEFANLNDAADLFNGDILFSCLGTTAKQAGSIKAQRVVDLDYQYTAAKLAVEQGVKNYLLVSSSGANAKSSNAYMRMKGELEGMIEKLGFEHISIFQPSLLLGERIESRFAEELGSKLVPLICKLPGLQRYRPIRGDQVAEKMVAVSMNPSGSIKRYTLDAVFPN